MRKARRPKERIGTTVFISYGTRDRLLDFKYEMRCRTNEAAILKLLDDHPEYNGIPANRKEKVNA
jgi:hypothetical protein